MGAPDRVVAWDRREDATFAARPHVRLGESERVVWAAVEDEALLPPRPAAAPSLIYFSRSELEEAVRDLGPADTAEVVERRLASFVPADQVSGLLHRDERRCLALAARAHAAATSPEARAALAVHFERGVTWLATLTGERRYDRLPATELLVLCVEAEAMVAAERAAAAEAAAHAGAPEAAVAAQRRAADEHLARARLQAGWLERRGRPQFAQALPYSDPTRGALVSPADEGLLAQLHHEHLPHLEWRDGVVMPVKSKKIAALVAAGKTVELVYLGAGELAGDIEELTQAQHLRELAAGRARLAAAPLEAQRAHVQACELDLLLLESTALELLSTSAPGAAPDLGAQVARSAESLREELASGSPWATGGDLLEAERAALRDVQLAVALARRDERADLAGRLDRLRQAKEHDLVALAPHLGG